MSTLLDRSNYNMKSQIIRLFILSIAVLFTGLSYAERLLVHKDEQKAMDALMKKLGVDERNITVGKRSYEINRYSDYFKAGTRYYHKGEGELGFSVITDELGHVAFLAIRSADIDDISGILSFKNLVYFDLSASGVSSLKGIENLKRLARLEITGNDKLTDLNGIRNLPVLREVDATTLKNIEVSGMTNLPKLEDFICDFCLVDNISVFSKMRSLRVLRTKIKQKNIDPLSALKKLEVLAIGGENLEDISIVRTLPKLKHLEVLDSSVENLHLDNSTPDLEFLYLLNSPIYELPDISQLKKLKKLMITGTNIKNVNSVHSLPELKYFSIARCKNLKRIYNLHDLPELEELKAYNGGVDEIETGYLPSLKELTLSKINITKMPNFENFPKLRKLKIEGSNNIKSLSGIEKSNSLLWVHADYEVRSDPENAKLIRGLIKNRIKFD